MNEEKFLKHTEARRQNVIRIVEDDYAGNSQIILPAIIVEFTTYQLLEKYDMFKVLEISRLIDMFLTGYGIGQRQVL